MKNYGLVSIITPSYNSKEYIAATIESMIAQTYPYWELLITDDCSTDNTRSIVQQYAEQDDRIKLFCLSNNSGAGVARNNSIREAKGRFIAFCDSDDRWYPHKLEKQLCFMNTNNYEFSYTAYDMCDEKGEIMGYVECLSRLSYITLIRDNGVGCLTGIYDTARIGKIYMSDIRKRQDWSLWLQIVRETKYAYGLQERLALYRIRRDSISSDKIALLKYNYRLYRKVERFSAFSSICLLLFYFLPYYFWKKAKYVHWTKKIVKS